MSTEFQKRKVAGEFDALNVDKDGRLDADDFQSLTDRRNDVRPA